MEDIVIIFDSIKRYVLIEKAPFLVKVDESVMTSFGTESHYMVRNINERDYESMINAKSLKERHDVFMIVDSGLKPYEREAMIYVGYTIKKNDVEILGGFNKLNKWKT